MPRKPLDTRFTENPAQRERELTRPFPASGEDGPWAEPGIKAWAGRPSGRVPFSEGRPESDIRTGNVTEWAAECGGLGATSGKEIQCLAAWTWFDTGDITDTGDIFPCGILGHYHLWLIHPNHAVLFFIALCR